jgi:AhpD family alkylhydroperoxidase
MHHHHDVLRDLREPTRSLRLAIPEVWAGFTALHEHAMADGEIPLRLKEAIALAMSVIKRCDGCIAYHARAAARARATPGEVAELLGVSLLMDGGPATSYAPRAWEAFLEFSADAEHAACLGPTTAHGSTSALRPATPQRVIPDSRDGMNEAPSFYLPQGPNAIRECDLGP